jgi:hypothetical protein
MRNKTAVFLHLYHQDQAKYFYDYLFPIKDMVDLYITLPDSVDTAVAVSMFSDLNTKIDYVDNVGGDILPFLRTLVKYGSHYKYFFKIHSKKSLLHRFCNWKEILVYELLGSPKILKQNCLLLDNTFIDSIGPLSMLMNHDRCHKPYIHFLMDELGIPFDNYSHFVGGTMFAGCSETYLKYFNKEVVDYIEGLMIDNKELGRTVKDQDVKGLCVATYIHALERIFGYLGNLYPITMSTITVNGINSPKQIVITKNNEVYCHNDNSICGNIVEEDLDNLTIIWKHKRPRRKEIYKKISENTITKVTNDSR